MKSIFKYLFILSITYGFSQKNDFRFIDSFARECPVQDEFMISTLSTYLKKGAKTDLEKCRAIYIWLTDNIRYDDYGYNTGNYSDAEPESALNSRKVVCAGFANLFTALGLAMGLKVETVSGYAKGYGHTDGDVFNESNHAWNRVLLDGTWKYFDATWGQGYGTTTKDGKLKSYKLYDEDWFAVADWDMIYSHYPQEMVQNTLFAQVTKSDFESMPYITPKKFSQLKIRGKELFIFHKKNNSWTVNITLNPRK